MVSTTVDQDLLDLVDSVMRDMAASGSRGSEHVARNWKTLASVGLTRLTASAESGGAGAGWQESAAVLRSAAYHGVPLPIAEHDLLAGWLRAEAGLADPGAISTACQVRADDRSPVAPWLAVVDQVVVLYATDGGWHVTERAAVDVDAVEAPGISGEPRSLLRWHAYNMSGAPVHDRIAEEFVLRGALARSIQISGALARIVDLSVAHAKEREQFGRPLARFQAVQHMVAGMAAEVALARSAVDAAVAAVAGAGTDWSALRFRVATARSCVGHASTSVVRGAHQLHGAIGTTAEHDLRLFTLPVLAWRSEYGSVRYWDEELTRLAVSHGAGAWSLVTSGRSVDA